MHAKASSSPPLDAYALTAEDKRRFAEEAALGMVAPQDPRLNTVAQAVAPDAITTPEVQRVIARLLEAAGEQVRGSLTKGQRRRLVGLAAPQIGVPLRIIVVDTKVTAERKKASRLECLINPEIIWRSRETAEGREGCFSAGPVWGLVRRPIAVKIRAFAVDGRPVEHILEDFTARIAQHECDHLEGIRFPDRIKSDRKRHWVHTEELDDYPHLMRRWPRLCSHERWQQYKQTPAIATISM